MAALYLDKRRWFIMFFLLTAQFILIFEPQSCLKISRFWNNTNQNWKELSVSRSDYYQKSTNIYTLFFREIQKRRQHAVKIRRNREINSLYNCLFPNLIHQTTTMFIFCNEVLRITSRRSSKTPWKQKNFYKTS